MAEWRRLYNDINLSERANILSDESALLFTWGLPHLDDDGRAPGDARWWKGKIAPWRAWSEEEVGELLAEIIGIGLLWPYQGPDGRPYVFSPTWKERQPMRKDTYRSSRYPAPSKADLRLAEQFRNSGVSAASRTRNSGVTAPVQSRYIDKTDKTDKTNPPPVIPPRSQEEEPEGNELDCDLTLDQPGQTSPDDEIRACLAQLQEIGFGSVCAQRGIDRSNIVEILRKARARLRAEGRTVALEARVERFVVQHMGTDWSQTPKPHRWLLDWLVDARGDRYVAEPAAAVGSGRHAAEALAEEGV